MYAPDFIEPPPEIWQTNYEIPDWSRVLVTRHARYKVIYGGRGSSKSWTIAACILQLIVESKRPLKIISLREKDNSIEDSAGALFKGLIGTIYNSVGWQVNKRTIRYLPNGSVIRFRGMSDVNEASIRSIEGVDIFWFEEAQYMSRQSLTTLYPGVRRPGAELWVTFNPRYRSDPVWTDFVGQTARSAQAIIMKINYVDNPWLDEGTLQEIANWKIDQPETFAHEWLGEPDDEGSVRKVLPFHTVQVLVEAWDKWAKAEKYEPSGKIHVGFDISDTGSNFNALAARRGPVLFHCERWTGRRRLPRGQAIDPEDWDEIKSLYTQTARHADRQCREIGAARMYYDASGLGGPMRSLLTEIAQEKGKAYRRHGIQFGGKVAGPTVKFNRTDNNEDYFYRRNSQLWWGLQSARAADAAAARRARGQPGRLPVHRPFGHREPGAAHDRPESAGVGAGRERPDQGREAAEDRGGSVGEDGLT